MSVSLEVLAMAGEDYANHGIEMEEWERAELEETPAYLLADENDDQQQWSIISNFNDRFNISHYVNARKNNYEDGTRFEASQDCEASSRDSLSLRGLVMMITAMIRLTMLTESVENIMS
ncbi:uncharacterized protein LOC125498991 [Beta vulgaris subsp. vulgaris]|uniref:uncharacterized protein LOC125498991 n=1 Tax=Beta vulgaris subsp. vulgaris TaxID=3555 RepID=UPI0020369DE0|nr:uncharacterized protein LOC125498991 [Beta vulgaris subsp. vulgaris]